MEVKRLFDLLDRYQHDYLRKDDAVCGKKDGEWVKYSTRDYIQISENIALGLLSLGLQRGDKVGLIAANRPEWNFIDMGISLAGMISVPVYPTIGVDEYAYIIEHAEIKVLFIGNSSVYKNVKGALDQKNLDIKLYSFDEVPGVKDWNEVIDLGEKNKEKYLPAIQKVKEGTKPDDLMTIIYTSGTTGFPKGVMLSHWNMLSNAISTSYVQPFAKEHRTLSFLPLNHVYERMMNYHFQYKGLSIYYAESMGKIVDNLKEVNPHIFNTVPRLLEKVYDTIIGKGKTLPTVSKMIFFWAIKLGTRFDCHKRYRLFYNLKLKIARKLIFSKWQAALGGEVKAIVSGGAALQPRLEHIFGAAGIQICEGYGLTETSPVVAVNWYYPLKNYRYGTVGKVLENVDVKIAEDGEICVKGPNVMLGYYKQPDLTNEAIDSEGYFHTGDIGVLDNDNFLTITDRKKEIFKTSAGKYVAPQSIENKLKESFFIEQLMVIGENEKFASALISPNFTYLHDWCSQHKIQFQDNDDLIKIPEVNTVFQKEVNFYNQSLGEFEKIKRFRLVSDSWSPQTGELSPTLKLKRNIIKERYHDLIEEVYAPTRELADKDKVTSASLSAEMKSSIIRSTQVTPIIKANFRDKEERKKLRDEKVEWKNERKRFRTDYRNKRRSDRVTWKNKRRDEKTDHKNALRLFIEEWAQRLDEIKMEKPDTNRKVWKVETIIEKVEWKKKRKVLKVEWRKDRKTEKIEWKKNRKKERKQWEKTKKVGRVTFKMEREIKKLKYKAEVYKQLNK